MDRITSSKLTNRSKDLAELNAIFSACIGGMRYGVKIRFPHALVMTLLFAKKNTTAKQRIMMILSATYEHSKNLATFATIYKSLLLLMKKFAVAHRSYNRNLKSTNTHGMNMSYDTTTTSDPGYPDRIHHAIVAGGIGGFIVWGKYSSINYQILLYLSSRVAVALVQLAREKGIHPFRLKRMIFKNVYPIYAAIIWGIVMALYEGSPNHLHPSLKKSMDEIYRWIVKNERFERAASV